MSDSNPLIYNKEQFNYNQIKKNEIFLYDETICPWIVGYMPKNQSLDKITFTTGDSYDIDLRSTAHADWTYAKYIGANLLAGNLELNTTRVPISWSNDNWFSTKHAGCQAYQTKGSCWTKGVWMGTVNEGVRFSEENYNKALNDARNTWIDWDVANNYLQSLYGDSSASSAISDLTSFNGNKILFSDGVYKVNFSFTKTEIIDKYSTDEEKGIEDTITTYLANCFKNKYAGDIKHINKLGYSYSVKYYTLSLTKVDTATTVSFSIPSTTNNLSDAPYKMFCMPYPVNGPTISFSKTEGGPYSAISKDIMDWCYNAIIANTTTGTDADTLYDVQILPYCPMKFKSASYLQAIKENLLTFNSDWKENIDYVGIKNDAGEDLSYIFFPTESSFTFTTEWGVASDNSRTRLYKTLAVDNIKISNETDFIRFVSPNYSGQFDMSVAKNKELRTVSVLATYKPYNPYIQVLPTFDGLYGSSFNDARGLICTGDFSLPIINSAWVQYELNNKTYQQAFNREVQHLEVSNEIARQNQLASSITGSLTGGIAGATAGSLASGNIAGTVAGAALGTVASAAGGVLDYQNLIKTQQENLSYAKDTYNYNLQNIQALPNSLAKTSSLNANSKYVPFIEVYSATDEEKELLKNYLEYNGMTAGYTGTFGLSGYVEASIIKYNGDLIPSQLAELNNELIKGVYFD